MADGISIGNVGGPDDNGQSDNIGDVGTVMQVFGFITGPPTHCVGARLVTVSGVCRRL